MIKIKHFNFTFVSCFWWCLRWCCPRHKIRRISHWKIETQLSSIFPCCSTPFTFSSNHFPLASLILSPHCFAMKVVIVYLSNPWCQTYTLLKHCLVSLDFVSRSLLTFFWSFFPFAYKITGTLKFNCLILSIFEFILRKTGFTSLLSRVIFAWAKCIGSLLF